MFGDKTSTDDLFTEKVENVWDDPGHKNTVKRCGPPWVKKFRNLGMVPKISQWFRKLGMVAKIRDGLDLRNYYENVVTLSTLGIFSKIGSTYLRLLPSSAFNYLRHFFTRCPCFFLKYFGGSQIFCKFSLKSKLQSFNLLVDPTAN